MANDSEPQVKPQIEPGWGKALADEFARPYFKELKRFLLEEKKTQTVFPPSSLIFNAFNTTPFAEVRVVILGQDPYHGTGQAHGLSFSVLDGISHPPSLQNIFKELKADLGLDVPKSGNLTPWAKQGVLLLNATLTVRKDQAGSHQKRGWETFTDAAIARLSEQREGIVFILWGSYARSKRTLIDTGKHFVLESPHPSPLSAHSGFFGSRPFSKANEYLVRCGQEPIDWKLGG